VDSPERPLLIQSRLVAILTSLLLVVTTQAHVVEQLFAEVIRGGPDWEIEVLFDAGYAKPEWRGDPDTPQPTREWLVSLSLDEQLALCEETASYLEECLSFTAPEGEIEAQAHFIDFDQSPPDFPNILNDGAYLRVRLTPATHGSWSHVDCRLNDGDRPDFVFEISSPDDPKPKYLTLKPGESFILYQDEGSTSGQPGWIYSLEQGFLHVLPDGLDHILFILTLFLLQRSWKPLLWQSLAFTVAHSVTLGLTAAGIITPHSKGIEAMIALSIAIMAMENLFRKECSSWRIIMVFGFGLIHGMGFANALSSQLTPGDGFLGRLILANLGVEIAQITILGLAWILTAKWCETPSYKTFRTAANVIIAIIASVWLIQRFAA
jgi:hydrogenase/urease accessory protein HupE